jgi:hypothetical protein
VWDTDLLLSVITVFPRGLWLIRNFSLVFGPSWFGTRGWIDSLTSSRSPAKIVKESNHPESVPGIVPTLETDNWKQNNATPHSRGQLCNNSTIVWSRPPLQMRGRNLDGSERQQYNVFTVLNLPWASSLSWPTRASGIALNRCDITTCGLIKFIPCNIVLTLTDGPLLSAGFWPIRDLLLRLLLPELLQPALVRGTWTWDGLHRMTGMLFPYQFVS